MAINLAKFRPNEISGEFIFNYMPLKRYCGENAGQLRGYFRMQEEVPSKLMQEYADFFFFQDPPIQRAKIETIGVAQTKGAALLTASTNVNHSELGRQF